MFLITIYDNVILWKIMKSTKMFYIKYNKGKRHKTLTNKTLKTAMHIKKRDASYL